MPTGYTAAIADGIDFETFALSCARQFAASAPGAPIPERFTPSRYHRDAADKAREEHAELLVLSPREAERRAREEHQEAVARHQEREAERARVKKAYEDMLADVERWEPPSHNHEALKDFMRDQLTMCLQLDFSPRDAPAVPVTGERWRQAKIAAANYNVEFHEKQYAEEVLRVAERNEWLRALRASLS